MAKDKRNSVGRSWLNARRRRRSGRRRRRRIIPGPWKKGES